MLHRTLSGGAYSNRLQGVLSFEEPGSDVECMFDIANGAISSSGS
jgi:hypothetical protein